ncbi:MAG: leucine-rich repeat protein [Clostridia bacterium]|nr:leucine-rich repeat protein [Clostridia bacterium]
MSNQKEYSRYMSNFRGIDTTSEASNVALNRFSFVQNMYKDYRSGQGVAIETFPGARTLCSGLGGTVYGMHTYKVTSGEVYIIVHAGEKLYYFDKNKRDELSTDSPAEFSGITMKKAKSSSFVYNNRLCLIDGENYITVYEDEDDTGNKILKAEHVDNDTAYVPTTFLNKAEYEQRNMLTSKFIEKSSLETLELNTDIPEKKEYSGALICPVISHKADYYYFGKYYRCLCGQIDADNNFRSFSFTAREDNDTVEIDFNQVKIDWETCYKRSPRYYRVKSKTALGYDNADVFKRPTFHLDKNETITIKKLKARKDNVEVTDENGIYQYEFYSNIDDAYLDVGESNNEANRRSLLTSVTMKDNVTKVTGTLAGCSNLKTVLLSNNITELSADFFADTAIEIAYLPYHLEAFIEVTTGKKLFDDCTNLKTIYAPSNIYDKLTANKGDYGIEDNIEIISYESKFMSGVPNMTTEVEDNPKNRVYIRTPCENVTSVRINGGEIQEYSSKPEEPENPSVDTKYTLYYPIYRFIGGKKYVIAVEFYHLCYKEGFDESGGGAYVELGGETEVNGTVEINGEAYPSVFTTSEEATGTTKDAITAHENYKGDALKAIKHCTVCCTFDDRIFFTGNPDLPNTVFYTQRDLTGHNNPTYVGVLNWFDDGMGNTPNVAMMSNASTLMVLKGNTMQDGSIYYHTGADGGNDLTPRIYPSVEGLAGLGCVGMAVNFRDDCVFMSNQGLEAIAKQTVNLERTIQHRSTNIDGLMLHSELASARAAEWEGYLCILINGKMFLADSRQAFEGIGGAMEYEWYYVADVCGYDGDNKKYFLADYMPPEIAKFCESNSIGISDSEDRRVRYIDEDKNGENDLVKSISFNETVDDIPTNYTVYYVEQGLEKYLVESYSEMENGMPDMACEICAVEDVLLFGTKNGRLLCLNNDKRGTDEEEPDKSRIPVEWYNNSGHAYDAVAVFAMENAGVPHYTKTTVKRGTVLRLKAFPQSSFEVYATTDRQATTLLTSQSNSVTAFGDIDFENLGLLTSDSGILAIKEKTKKWVEKQYMFKSERANRPFGLYSLTYRYIIAGDVKNK